MIKWSLYDSCVQEGDGEGCLRRGGERRANKQVSNIIQDEWGVHPVLYRVILLKQASVPSLTSKSKVFPPWSPNCSQEDLLTYINWRKLKPFASKRLLRYCSVYLGLRFTSLQDHYLLFYQPSFTSDDLEEDTHQEQWLWDVPWGPFRTKGGIPAALRASCLFPTSLWQGGDGQVKDGPLWSCWNSDCSQGRRLEAPETLTWTGGRALPKTAEAAIGQWPNGYGRP